MSFQAELTGRSGLSPVETACLAVGGFLLFWRAAPPLFAEWFSNPDCSHVFLALPVAVVFLFMAVRRGLSVATKRASPAWAIGTALIAPALAILFVGRRLEEESLLGAGLLILLLGVIALLWGRGVFVACLFPALLLAFAVPLPHAVTRNLLHIHLQRGSAAAASGLLSLAGTASDVSGSIVTVASKELNVAEACSGLKFLTASLFAALCVGRLVLPGHLFARVALAAFSIVAAFMANVMRLAAGALVMVHVGAGAADYFLHGWPVFLVYIAALALLAGAALLMKNFLAESILLPEDPPQ